MRSAIWSCTAAVLIASVTVSLLVGVFEHPIFALLRGAPLPILTNFATRFHWVFLVIPGPFIVAAIWLSRGENASDNAALGFAGVAILVVVLLFSFTALALMAPFVELISPF